MPRHLSSTRVQRGLALVVAMLASVLGGRAQAEREPATIVVLGATGDLSGRLLTPALTEIIGELPKGSRVVGVGRSTPALGSDADFRGWLKDRTRDLAGKLDEKGWDSLKGRLHFQAMDLTRAADYLALKQRLSALDAADQRAGEIAGPRRVIFYYATAPSLIGATTDGLAKVGLIGPQTRNDVVPEKPIGTDGDSAHEVMRRVIEAAGAEHVYFMDHYNGKPGVQRMQALRADPRFAKIWNKRYIDHIEVKALESIGAEGRGAFYDPTGATRDMVQSHLLQALSFATMQPRSGAAADVESAKIGALESLRFVKSKPSVVRGQYVAGGKLGPYTAEPGVAPASTTETYVKLRLASDARPLKHVPITVETGKGLREKRGEIVIELRRLPLELAVEVGQHPRERARLRVDLASGEISLAGRPIELASPAPRRSAYATQLLHVLDREHANFPSAREVGAAWKLIDPIERGWKQRGRGDLALYKAGGAGPSAAKRLAFRPDRGRLNRRLPAPIPAGK